MKISTLSGLVALALSTSAVHAQEDKPFTMDGEFGFIFTSGNTETTSANAGIDAHHELEKWSNDFVLKWLYKKDTVNDIEQVTARKFFASGQGNYKLENPNHRVFVFGSYEDDKLSNFEYQGTIAAGWNQKVWGDDTSSFEYSIGPGYSFVKTQEVINAAGVVVQPSETDSSPILRAALNYTYVLSETSKFTQKFSTEVGSDNTKSRSESAVTAKIAGNLSMKVSLKLDHNSDVADSRENLDTETSVNLVYSFF